MFRPLSTALAVAAAFGALALASRPAVALVHLWDFTEVYSNADGSIQFVEFFTDTNFQFDMTGAFIHSAATGMNFSFPNDVPLATVDRHLLVATAGFDTIPGGITPDFVLPANFVDTDGDILSLVDVNANEVVSSFFFGGLVPLPTNGIDSLNRDFGDTLRFVAVNSPTNFAGDAGSVVPEPGTLLLLSSGLLGLAVLGRRRDTH